MTSSALRVAAYARYSTDRQNPLSTDDQLAKCCDYAREHGWLYSQEHVYTDSEISGAMLDRPGLRLLLAAADSKPRPFDVLLIIAHPRHERIALHLALDGYRLPLPCSPLDVFSP